MAELDLITPKEARARMEKAYCRSGEGPFLEALKRPLSNHIEQRDDKGRKKPHPLIVVGLILGALAAATLIYFTLWR
jgi:hypothetical protein